MAYEYFIANGFTSTAANPGEYWGMSEMRIRNLGAQPTRVRQTLYFCDRAPFDLPEIEVGPLGGPYREFPRDLPPELREAGPWGSRIASDTPLAFVHISLARRNGRREEKQFAGGCAFQLARAELSRRWIFPDCFKMIMPPENPRFPMSQYEWYHFLNPSRDAARLRITVADDSGVRNSRELVLPGERVCFLDDIELVPGDWGACYLEVQSDRPILAEGERAIFSPAGPLDWGVIIGCASPGAPA